MDTRTRRIDPATAGLLAAAVLYGLLALLVTGLDRQLRWDEVTYLAQVTPGQPDVWFGPQRARGMTLVLAPVGLLGAPTALLRGWLILVHAAAMVWAFRPFTVLAGWTGVVAATLTAIGWVPLYFAVEGYPNLLAGFASVAAAGATLRWVVHDERRQLLLVGLAIAVVAWLRPSESVWIAAALTPVVLVTGRRAWRAVAAFALGGFVGWLPWLVEAIVRFGGPFERLAGARATSTSGADRNSLIQYLNLIEGPVRRVVEDPVLTVPGLALLVAAAVLIVLGLLPHGDRARRRVAVVGLWAGAVMVTPYLVLNAGINLRYLLPGLLLLTLPVAAGVVTVVEVLVRRRSRTGAVVLAVLALTTVGWQLHLAARNAADIAALQARPVALGAALAEAADGAPCAFLSNVQWPEIQWHSGCLGEVLVPPSPHLQCPDARRDLGALAADGYRVFVLERGQPPFSPVVADWPVEQLPEPEDGVWYRYERPADLGPEAPPSIPPADDPTQPCLPSRAPDTSDAQLELRWSR
ncbi:MAG: hypothetical protein R6U94_10115 [Nitriliruptoraceae bacterium]